jgi:hypothetical protein
VWCPGREEVIVSIKRRDTHRLPFRDRFLVQVADASAFPEDGDCGNVKEISRFVNATVKSKVDEFRLHATYTEVDKDEYFDAPPLEGPTAATTSNPSALLAPVLGTKSSVGDNVFLAAVLRLHETQYYLIVYTPCFPLAIGEKVTVFAMNRCPPMKS